MWQAAESPLSYERVMRFLGRYRKWFLPLGIAALIGLFLYPLSVQAMSCSVSWTALIAIGVIFAWSNWLYGMSQMYGAQLDDSGKCAIDWRVLASQCAYGRSPSSPWEQYSQSCLRAFCCYCSRAL